MTFRGAGFAWRCAGSAVHRLGIAFLVACVLCAQALGLMHGVVHAFHAHAHQATQATSAVQAHEAASAAHTHAHGGIAALFAFHDEAQDCRLFDGPGQQAPALAPPAMALVLMPGLCLRRELDLAFIARWAALFDARGPPLSH